MVLYDSLTRAKQPLPPPPGPIRMYVCGPTVYQRVHVGNARPYVVFLWLKRWLEEQGYDVTLVENITDVNDKIYEAAPGRSAELAAEATRWYLEDTAGFGLGMPDAQPLATASIPEIVALIEDLLASGHAYAADGDVYFYTMRPAALIVDVNGVADTGVLSFANQRTDTRHRAQPLLPAGSTLRLPVPAAFGGATVIGQLTADRVETAGFVTAFGCDDAGDVDDDASIRPNDAVLILAFLFQRGDPPAAPFPGCGIDPTTDALGCALFRPC